jgi:hypothetical protein
VITFNQPLDAWWQIAEHEIIADGIELSNDSGATWKTATDESWELGSPYSLEAGASDITDFQPWTLWRFNPAKALPLSGGRKPLIFTAAQQQTGIYVIQ